MKQPTPSPSNKPLKQLVAEIQSLSQEIGARLIPDDDKSDHLDMGLAHVVAKTHDDPAMSAFWFGYCLILSGVEHEGRVKELMDLLMDELKRQGDNVKKSKKQRRTSPNLNTILSQLSSNPRLLKG